MIRPAALTLALALAAAVAPHPAAADPAETARRAALELLEAVEALAEARRARDQVAALTRVITAHESGLEALREGLRAAALREAAIARQFEAQSEQISRLMAALMTVGQVEGPALLLHPGGALGTARAGMLMADLAPALQAEAARVGALLVELRELRRLRSEAHTTLAAALTSLQAARTELSTAIAERRTPPPPIGEDEARLLALLGSAQTLEALAAGLAALPAGAAAGVPFAEGRGRLPLPVVGAVVRRAGEADAAGIARPGLVLATVPGALLVAPWDSTVRWRGPLADYGNVILLEPDAGYLLLVAGLEAVFVHPGEVVAAGAPLGQMPGGAAAGTEFVGAEPPGRTATAYVELRYRGQPIDPAEWFDLSGSTP